MFDEQELEEIREALEKWEETKTWDYPANIPTPAVSTPQCTAVDRGP
jgi:hypothetical protein